ncbi:MAG: hypothetical protein LKF48_09175 [Prevotella sp.]|jgi:hypothetical protein|nr:hypothetical protein [Prevotella sp.]MCH4183312.1 hypothetical protein [Prevotella sp.]MCH4242100.1 hypothetical protein [Prevotella sp.]
MKYFIPILSSNIDNVLSSESISPASSYEYRNFGYKRFDTLPDAPKNQIILYNGIESSPSYADKSIVYIEIDDTQLENIQQVSKGVFSVDKTIYLYPWNTKFLFDNIKDYQDAMIFCRGSLCNKMWENYQFRLVDPTVHKGKTHINNSKVKVHHASAEDERYNRLKGFIFGWAIGQCISLSSDLAMLRKYAKKISDLCSVIPKMPFELRQSYKEQVNSLKSIYNSYDPNRKFLKEKWDKNVLAFFSSDKDRIYFENILKKYGSLGDVMSKFAEEQNITLGPSVKLITKQNDWRLFKEELDTYTDASIQNFFQMRNTEDFFKYVKLNAVGIISINDVEDVYIHIINDLINGQKFLRAEHVAVDRLNTSTDITLLIKKSIENSGKDWKDSLENIYFNSLRQNIVSAAPFDAVVGAPNDITAALAIYLLRCDDFEDMIRFAVVSGFGRYDLLLGLWGANKGYIDMPKTIFSYLNINSKQKEKAYLLTYRLMNPDDAVLHAITICSHEIKNKQNQSEGARKEVPQDLFLGSLINMEVLLKQKELKFNKEQQDRVLSIYNERHKKINDDFFQSVAKIKNIGKVKIKKFKEVLHYKEKNPIEFLLPLGALKGKKNLSVDDWKKIKPYCGQDLKSLDQIHNDFVWFIKHNKGPYMQMVKEYYKYIKSRKITQNQNLAWLAPFYKNVDMDAIYDILARK